LRIEREATSENNSYRWDINQPDEEQFSQNKWLIDSNSVKKMHHPSKHNTENGKCEIKITAKQ